MAIHLVGGADLPRDLSAVMPGSLDTSSGGDSVANLLKVDCRLLRLCQVKTGLFFSNTIEISKGKKVADAFRTSSFHRPLLAYVSIFGTECVSRKQAWKK